MKQERILVVAAHPDDEVLGCGGTLARRIAHGATATVLILTDGGLQRYGAEQIARLKTAARAAGEALGYSDVRFCDLPDQELDALPLVRVVRAIEAVVEELRPDTVFTHHEGDVNYDHNVALRATMAAVRPLRMPFVRRVYSYSVLSSTEQGPLDLGAPFAPNVYEDISDYLEVKCRALACYESECRPFPHPRSLEAVRAHARVTGAAVGCAAAEPFVLRRELR